MKKAPKKLVLNVVPINLKGKAVCRVTAICDDEPLHADTFDIGNAQRRAAFLNRAARAAKDLKIKVRKDRYERVLLNFLRNIENASVTPVPDTSIAKIRDPGKVLSAFGIEVLGEQENQAISCWITRTKKRWTIKSPADWPENEILQAIGPEGAALLWTDGKALAPDGRYSAEDLRRAVALVASRSPRITANSFIGQGVWLEKSQILVVNGAYAHTYDGISFQRVDRPTIGKRIIDFNSNKAWANGLCKRTKKMSWDQAKQAFERLWGIVKQWNWSHPRDSEVVASLICATFVQACWTWRPLISIIGPSDCGKSTFIEEVLVPLFGEWSLVGDRSSEAGIRQAIGHDAAPVIIDEFDKYKQRQQVLELFRTASRGGSVLRGTQDQSGRQFRVRHMPWFAAIESGDLWGQDRNRFIRFEMRPPNVRGKLVLPGRGELAELGQELMAAALWAAPFAVPLANQIKAIRIPGVYGRLIESFSVAAAMFAVVYWGGRASGADAGREILKVMVGGRAVQSQGEKDEIQLLRDIFASNIRVPTISNSGGTTYEDRTVGQLLQREKGPGEGLEAKGLCIVKPRGEASCRLFLVHDVIRRELLAATRWGTSRIDQILSRLDGAERTQQRCGGQKPWGISLPWPGCLESLGVQGDGQDTEEAEK